MICPHCKTGIHDDPLYADISFFQRKKGPVYAWRAKHQRCPECGEVFISIQGGSWSTQPPTYQAEFSQVQEEHLVWPQEGHRVCPPEIPENLKKDFLEAAAVLPISPQASAALTRRCLQHLLRDYGNAKKRDLADQIDEVAPTLPGNLSDQLHAVRNIGNFAAHPQKSTNSGEILEVEPQEADWNLDVLEELFDHYFVKPALLQKRKEALNKKLAEAGKPLLA
jgi:hypothetical protein